MNFTLSLENAVLLVVMTTSFLAPFMGSATNLAIPAIGAEFESSPLHLSWMVASYLLASAAFLLPVGRIADIIGRKKVLAAGLILFSFFAFLSGMAWSMSALIVLRTCHGAVSTMIFSTGIAILTSVYPPHKRGHAMGLTAAATYIGLSLGPVLGGFMTHQFGWRSVFFFTGLLAGCIAILAIWRLKGEWADAKEEKFDIIGSLLYIVTIPTILYGLSSISNNITAKLLLAIGLALLAFFVYYESKLRFPIFHVSLFRDNRVFAFSNLAAMINYCATFAVSFIISLYLQVVMGYNSQIAGLIMLSQPLLMALCSPFAGALSDRIEPRIVASCGMGFNTLGLFLFIFVTPDTPIWRIIANLTLIGLGFALFASPNNNAIMGSVEKRFYSVAASTLGTMRLTGQAISMAIITLLLSVYASDTILRSTDSQTLVSSAHDAFIVFTIICAIGMFASLARGKVARQNGVISK
ncbi:MAG: major facilitator superfamily 1 [Firmicutes bacterium]|nr:major facilitator superfamily 1 [Bacillota bacterium]